MPSLRPILVLCCLFGWLPAASLGKYAIDLQGAMTADPPSVLLRWEAQADGVTMTLQRRPFGPPGTHDWSDLGDVDHTTTSWLDEDLAGGEAVEYRLYRPWQRDSSDASVDQGYGYWTVAIERPAVDSRGELLLVVADAIATALPAEVDRLVGDLAGDGYRVIRYDAPAAITAAELRDWIGGRHAADPAARRCLFLLGRLPVVQSGYDAPDGHGSVPHATDAYYADVDGQWSDATDYGNGNEAGDGIFDQKRLPEPDWVTEMPVGRVDLAGMSAWERDEVTLIGDYLDKNHHYRQALQAIPRRVLWDGLAFDRTAFEAHAAWSFVGRESSTKGAFTLAGQDDDYLWGIDFSDWKGSNYPDYRFRITFALNFGSHKQKWSRGNNPMRAILCMPRYGLSCIWGVRPNWFLYSMGIGETLGDCQFRTINNRGAYQPVDDYGGFMDGGVWINLMGDPTLRLFPVPPPSEPEASRSGDGVTLRWTPSADETVTGYLVYRGTERSGPFVRISAEPVTGMSFDDPAAPSGTSWYQIRALRLERTAAASYWNNSQAAWVRIDGEAANRPPVPASPAVDTDEEVPVAIDLQSSDPDGDALAYGILVPPVKGQLSGRPPQLTYTPALDQVGEDAFTFTVSDGQQTVTGRATIGIAGIDDPPAAGPLHRPAIAGRSTPCPLTAIARDGEALTYAIADEPTGGSFSGTAPWLDYQAPAEADGLATASFTVSDGTSEVGPVDCFLHVAPFGDGTAFADFTHQLPAEWQTESGTWARRDGALISRDGSSNAVIRLDRAGAWDWTDCAIDLRVWSDSGNRAIAVQFHQQDDSRSSHYRFEMTETAMRLVRRTGSKTTLAEVDRGIALATWHQVGIRVRGTQATVTVDGEPVFAEPVALDADRLTAGAVALAADRNGSARFDDVCIVFSGPVPERRIGLQVSGPGADTCYGWIDRQSEPQLLLDTDALFTGLDPRSDQLVTIQDTPTIDG